MAGKPASLDALFKSKAKKKPKAMNLNAEQPPPAAKAAPAPRPAPSDAESAGANEGWERALRRDQDILKGCGLWIKDVEGDGACLFRAFADQLDGSVDGHADYREQCVDFLEAHQDDFEGFLGEDFGEYCCRMRQAATWGGHVEVQALSRSLGVNVVIFQPAEAGCAENLLQNTVDVFAVETSDPRCVQLSFHPTHHAGQHYNSVRCEGDDGEGPAPPLSIDELRQRIATALEPPAVAEPEAKVEEKPRGILRSKKLF